MQTRVDHNVVMGYARPYRVKARAKKASEVHGVCRSRRGGD